MISEKAHLMYFYNLIDIFLHNSTKDKTKYVLSIIYLPNANDSIHFTAFFGKILKCGLFLKTSVSNMYARIYNTLSLQSHVILVQTRDESESSWIVDVGNIRQQKYFCKMFQLPSNFHQCYNFTPTAVCAQSEQSFRKCTHMNKNFLMEHAYRDHIKFRQK